MRMREKWKTTSANEEKEEEDAARSELMTEHFLTGISFARFFAMPFENWLEEKRTKEETKIKLRNK